MTRASGRTCAVRRSSPRRGTRASATRSVFPSVVSRVLSDDVSARVPRQRARRVLGALRRRHGRGARPACAPPAGDDDPPEAAPLAARLLNRTDSSCSEHHFEGCGATGRWMTPRELLARPGRRCGEKPDHGKHDEECLDSREARLDERPVTPASQVITVGRRKGTSAERDPGPVSPRPERDTAGVERHHHVDSAVHRERRSPRALQGVPRAGSGGAFCPMVGATRRGFRVPRSASLRGSVPPTRAQTTAL